MVAKYDQKETFRFHGENREITKTTFEPFAAIFCFTNSDLRLHILNNTQIIMLKTKLLSQQSLIVIPNTAMQNERTKRNERIQEVSYSLDNKTSAEDVKSAKEITDEVIALNKLYQNGEDSNEEYDPSRYFIKNEDLQYLLLHYMKLTVELRKKNSTGTYDVSQISDETSTDLKNDDYSVSTDYDSEEESTPTKPISEPSIFKCKYCSKNLRGIHSLKNHCMRKHGNNEDKNILCDKCPTRFYTDFEFNRHYQTHYSVKNFLCHLCSKKFVQKSTLDLHLRYHENDRRYQCEICRKKFFTNNHLKRHCLTHTNRRDFKCEPCDRSFRYKDHLRRHLQSVHIGVRSHYCRECHKSFMYLSQLKFHEQSHTGVSHKCKHCKRVFKKMISLKVHQRQCKG